MYILCNFFRLFDFKQAVCNKKNMVIHVVGVFNISRLFLFIRILCQGQEIICYIYWNKMGMTQTRNILGLFGNFFNSLFSTTSTTTTSTTATSTTTTKNIIKSC